VPEKPKPGFFLGEKTQGGGVLGQGPRHGAFFFPISDRCVRNQKPTKPLGKSTQQNPPKPKNKTCLFSTITRGHLLGGVFRFATHLGGPHQNSKWFFCLAFSPISHKLQTIVICCWEFCFFCSPKLPLWEGAAPFFCFFFSQPFGGFGGSSGTLFSFFALLGVM